MKPASTSSALIGAFLLSGSVHAVPVIDAAKSLPEAQQFLRDARADVHDFLWTTYDIEPDPVPPKPEPEKPKEPDPEPEAPPPPPKVAPPRQVDKAPEKPPAAAEAGKTLTVKDDAPVNFTNWSLVQGAGEYRGGTTASDGTGKEKVDGFARGGDPGGHGTNPVGTATVAPTVAGPDLSRAATTANKDWNCSYLFPPEADADDINDARVSIIVTVRPDGSAQVVKILSDPGHGFGRAARTCALSQHYNAAYDRAGQPMVGTTAPFFVRFHR